MYGKRIWSSNIKSYNDDYSYLLVIIDVLSKYAWVEPLRDKTSNCIMKAFQHVYSRSKGRVPVYLQMNKGKEFIARPMQKFLKEIHFQVTRNPNIKAAIVELQQNVERVNVTLFYP